MLRVLQDTPYLALMRTPKRSRRGCNEGERREKCEGLWLSVDLYLFMYSDFSPKINLIKLAYYHT